MQITEVERTMNRLQEEMAHVEKEQEDRGSLIREGKKLQAIWLLHRLRTFRKMGLTERVILQDLEFECRKLML